jgi:hypothetical protein
MNNKNCSLCIHYSPQPTGLAKILTEAKGYYRSHCARRNDPEFKKQTNRLNSWENFGEQCEFHNIMPTNHIKLPEGKTQPLFKIKYHTP